MNTIYYLEVLQREFQLGSFEENLIKNLDEIYFIININNGCILGFREDTSIKYTDIAEGDAMTMVVHIFESHQSTIEAPMLIFTNKNSNYSILGLYDSNSRVYYCTGPKGWIN